MTLPAMMRMVHGMAQNGRSRGLLMLTAPRTVRMPQWRMHAAHKPRSGMRQRTQTRETTARQQTICMCRMHWELETAGQPMAMAPLLGKSRRVGGAVAVVRKHRVRRRRASTARMGMLCCVLCRRHRRTCLRLRVHMRLLRRHRRRLSVLALKSRARLQRVLCVLHRPGTLTTSCGGPSSRRRRRPRRRSRRCPLKMPPQASRGPLFLEALTHRAAPLASSSGGSMPQLLCVRWGVKAAMHGHRPARACKTGAAAGVQAPG